MLAFSAIASAAGLNDTGQNLCFDALNAAVACGAAVGGDSGVNPRQDGRYGRDAAAAAGQQTKAGSGAMGFDYSKVANDGSLALPNANLGIDPTEWACTKDNVTGLIWEVKTATGLRSQSYTYNWYSDDSATNNGDPGVLGSGQTCGGTLIPPNYFGCNTRSYIAAVNAATLCGASDWRLPTYRELLSLVHAGNTGPAIDAVMFPNTSSTVYWTKNTSAAVASSAWYVDFDWGRGAYINKGGVEFAVRLVRQAP